MSESPKVIEPRQIGPFRLHGTVGDGAFSVVKLVRQVETNKYYACKIVPKSRLNSINLEQRFETEIRINQQLRHPGIVEFVDLLKDENNFYVIMEFCPNGELFQFIIEHTRLDEAQARPLLRQILEALQYIHSKNVSHRDLKPENLLIDTVGKIKISDFGLSRYLGFNDLVNTPCGSPCYASPECVSGHPYDGKTTDVWSVGVILYAMLTGQLPWTKRNQTQLFQQIRRGEYVIPSYVSADAHDLIKGLMCVDTNVRLTISQALNHPWMTYCPIQFPLAGEIHYNVSLKAVDRFFEVDGSNEAIKVPNDRNSSCTQFAFNKVVKIIKAAPEPEQNTRPTKVKRKPAPLLKLVDETKGVRSPQKPARTGRPETALSPSAAKFARERVSLRESLSKMRIRRPQATKQ